MLVPPYIVIFTVKRAVMKECNELISFKRSDSNFRNTICLDDRRIEVLVPELFFDIMRIQPQLKRS